MLVHIAPEPELGKRLRLKSGLAGMTYRAGNISGTGEASLDIRSLPFADGEVGLIYCCHVLNCLQEDRVAMREVFRVLSDRGVALLQVPAYYKGTSTLETNTRDERLAAFSDEGIFRNYTGANYVERLESAGFEVTKFSANDLPEAAVRQFQLKREVLHVCRKRAA